MRAFSHNYVVYNCKLSSFHFTYFYYFVKVTKSFFIIACLKVTKTIIMIIHKQITEYSACKTHIYSFIQFTHHISKPFTLTHCLILRACLPISTITHSTQIVKHAQNQIIFENAYFPSGILLSNYKSHISPKALLSVYYWCKTKPYTVIKLIINIKNG